MLLWLLFYFGAFALVALWELYPGTTLAWGKFELIQWAVAVNGYFLGRFISQHHIMRGHVWLGLLLVAYEVGQIVFSAEVSRYGYGQELMLCLPAALLLRMWTPAVISVMGLLLSAHKSTLVAGLVSGGITLLFMQRRPLLSRRSMSNPFLTASMACGALIVGGSMFMVFSEQVASTVARFVAEDTIVQIGTAGAVGEGEDRLRVYTQEASLRLLPNYFIQGMGYMNFYEWTKDDLGDYAITNRFGNVDMGLNIHNSYMTWILEGGLLVSSVVGLLFLRLGRRIKALVKHPASRPIGCILIAWSVSLLIYGAFHQLHASTQMWTTVGMIFGLSDQFRNVA